MHSEVKMLLGKESINYSLRSIRARKSRSFFTVFSIMIGITTMFIFISFGMGLYKYVQDFSSSSSADKIIVQSKAVSGAGATSGVFSLGEDDLRAVESTSGVYEATPLYFKSVQITQGKETKYTYLFSFDPKIPIVMDLSTLKIEYGRDLSSGEKGVVLGSNFRIPDKIFSKPYSLGENIEINGEKYKIIGFYSPIGDPIDDAQIYLTNERFEEIYADENISYYWIVGRVDPSNIDKIVENVEKNLRKERGLEEGKEDFFVQSFADMMETYKVVLNIVVGFIILIALISVLVSSINTANTMITSVLERVKEIGVMKSIGAKNSEIFGIFLFESSFLGFVAGSLGVFFGWLLTLLAKSILNNIGYSLLSPFYSFWLFFGCIAFAVLTGAISGVFPAITASKTNPVDALRYE
jgi:putative ABC transport system permease protein